MVHLKMTGGLYGQMSEDLCRSHPFAAERVGFAFGRTGSLSGSGKLILLTRYYAIPDDEYVDDPTVGARIGPAAITAATQAVYYGRPAREGVFHVHLHGHRGPTGMSHTDDTEIPRLLPGFQSVGRDASHGILILSVDHGSGWVWLRSERKIERVATVQVIGAPLEVFMAEARLTQ